MPRWAGLVLTPGASSRQTLHYTTEFRRGLFQLTDSDLFLTEAKDGVFERSRRIAEP